MQAWIATLNSYKLGRVEDAVNHASAALNSCEASSLVASAHASNITALNPQFLQLPPLPSVDNGCSNESLFRCDIALTRAYNIALSLARKNQLSNAAVHLNQCSSFVSDLLLPTVATLCAQGHNALPVGVSPTLVRRVCSSYAATIQLRAAIALMSRPPDASTASELAADATRWLRAGATLDDGEKCPEEDGEQALARGACIQSLARASGQDLTAAVEELVPYAEPTENNTNRKTFWAAVYQSGAIRAFRALRNNVADPGAVSQLEACARAGYRASDAFSLSARIHQQLKRALLSFQSALALDYERLATLLATAEAFEADGKHEAQLELLECARDLVNTSNKPASDEKANVVQLVEPFIPSVSAIDLARARASLMFGKPSDTEDILNKIPDSEDHVQKARIAVLAMAEIGDVVRAVEMAEKYLNIEGRKLGAQLALSDARLCSENVLGAREILEEVTKAAVHEKLGNEVTESILRGICYNNRGVLILCGIEDVEKSGIDAFTAAQVAFDKAAAVVSKSDPLQKWAENAADSASWNKTLVLAGRGRMEGAASHWIGRRKNRRKRKSQTGFVKATSHVMGMVSEENMMAMDELARKIVETARSQRELEEIMRNAASQW